MSYEERERLLRSARTKALSRLRAEQEQRFQELVDEEVAAAGGEPRQFVAPYRPRKRTTQ